MFTMSTDSEVCEALRIQRRTLSDLLSQAEANGIYTPAVGGGKLRRWLGDLRDWATWMDEVYKCRHGLKNVAKPGRCVGSLTADRGAARYQTRKQHASSSEKSRPATRLDGTGTRNPVRLIPI